MKCFLIACFFILTLSIQAQTWSWADTPVSGATVMLTIKDAPPTEEKKSLTMYYINAGKLTAQSYELKKGSDKKSCTAMINLPAGANWVSFSLKDHEGELLSQYDVDISDDNTSKASSIEHAVALGAYHRMLGVEKNDKTTNSLFRDGIVADGNWLSKPEVLFGYYHTSKTLNSESDLNIIRDYLVSISKKPNGLPEALLVQSVRIAQAMGDSTLQLSLRKQTDKYYPKNLLVQEEEMLAFKKATLDEKVKLYNQYKSRYPLIEDNRMNYNTMAVSLAQAYAEKGNWDMVRKYVYEIPVVINQSTIANQYAWQLSGESTDTEGSHYDIAADLSATSLKILDGDVQKPSYLTDAEWQANINGTRAGNSDTYALILYKLGKYDEAVKYQYTAVKENDYADAEMNERYAIYLDKANRTDDLLSFLDKIVLSGKASAKTREMHKQYWTKTATQDQLYQQYLSQLEDRAHERLENKIRKMWKDEVPASFTLKDLNGQDVSLSNYKGKTVVLDFWATWCGPCKASFPGMKKAVEHYASDKDVVFLFVDTWEKKDNTMDSKVSSFIRENDYPFHVLMDREDKVVKDFNIKGIPTKYIIGPDQKVRFVSVGYNGSTEELVEEMKIMIEMARGGNPIRS